VISLAVASQKGGVGKTTVAVNLAYAFARRGWSTVLVDTDPQGSVGLSLSERARQSRGFFDCMTHGISVDECVLATRLPELQILVAGRCADPFVRRDTESQGQDSSQNNSVSMLVDNLAQRGHDLAIIDTAAGLTGYTADVLRASDYVLVPQQAEPLGLRSVPQMLQAVQSLRNEGHSLEMAGILLTMVQSDVEESADVVRELRQIVPPQLMLHAAIPRDSVFLRASAVGVPLGLLFQHPPAAAIIFDQVAAELESRIELNPEPKTTDQDDHTRLMD
jgi:chromosome partitioning protein